MGALSRVGETDDGFREDMARLLFDEATIADGEVPVDAKGFSARLDRLIGRALG